jgi:hypothetical protein
MLIVVIIKQNFFTVTRVVFTFTNIPSRHELKNVFVYYIYIYTTYATLNDAVVAHLLPSSVTIDH